jgi:hypothetical protein
MTRFALIATIAALVFTSSALALGGSVYAQISANWNTHGTVYVTVLSNHSFNGGTVNTTCANTTVNETQQLTAWTFDSLAHQYRIDTQFDISAAGSGANCTITVTDGHKVLAQQQFVSV